MGEMFWPATGCCFWHLAIIALSVAIGHFKPWTWKLVIPGRDEIEEDFINGNHYH